MLKKLTAATAGLLMALMPLTAVQVQAATGTTNLVSNPGVIADTTGWVANDWSTNTHSTVRITEGRNTATDGSLKTQITAVGTGADGWSTPSIAVTASQSYELSFWYKSDVAATIDVASVVNGAATTPRQVAPLPTSTTWTQFRTTYTAAAGETNVVFTPFIQAEGTLTTDDFNFVTYTPEALARPIVSVTFDDGWGNQYHNARTVLTANDINATFYLMSEPLAAGQGTAQGYMSVQQAKDLFADGHEIASHTLDHCSLSGVTKSAACTDPTVPSAAATDFITNELMQSKANLEALVPGSAVTNFAYPYGEYSAESINIAKNIYTSQRTIECGYNSKDSLDLTKLKACEVGANSTGTTVDYVKNLIDTAIAQNAWLVLFYHEIADEGQGVDGDEAYTTTIADFTAIMQYIKSKQDLNLVSSMSVAKAISTINGTTPPTTVKPGDINGNGVVNDDDATVMFANWGPVPGGVTTTAFDLNHNGVVNDDDATILFANWSK